MNLNASTMVSYGTLHDIRVISTRKMFPAFQRDKLYGTNRILRSIAEKITKPYGTVLCVPAEHVVSNIKNGNALTFHRNVLCP